MYEATNGNRFESENAHRSKPRKRWWQQLAIVAVCACVTTGPTAQVFRCTDVAGYTVFSDRACGSDAEKVEIVQSSGGLSQIQGDGLSAD